MSKKRIPKSFRRIRLRHDVLVVEEQETVYLIPRSAPPVRLNHAATRLWRYFQQFTSISVVVKKYSDDLCIPSSQAMLETQEFVRWLCVQELLNAR